MCPACDSEIVSNSEPDYCWEGTCAGCGQLETFLIAQAALAAHRSGELTDTQAFPNLTEDQRCLIDMACHVDCYSDAVYGRPPREPSPFATVQ